MMYSRLSFGIIVLIFDCHEFACPNACVKHKQHNVIIPKLRVVVLVQSFQKRLYVLDFRRLGIFHL